MCRNFSWLFILPSLVVSFLLSCSNSTSPFTASNTTVSIMLENSAHQRSTILLSDSVDKPVRIGISAYLSQYVDSVTVIVTGTSGDTEKTVSFGKSASWADTNWIADTFATSGTKTITAIAAIRGGRHYTDTATINILAKPAPTYAVAYDGNGSTGGVVPTDATAYQQGSVVTVKANIGSLVRAGYTFAGWNTTADGKGTSYSGGETFAMGTANVSLYAVWTQNPTYTVTYNGNGNTAGTVPADANSYQQGASVTVQGNAGNLARAGYTFAGWNTAADGSGTSYAGAATFNIGASNVTLYAVWTQNPTYTVVYTGNGSTGGTAPTDANAYQQGAVVNVKGNAGSLVRAGYTFAGWNTASDGGGTSYAGGATLTMGNANVTLYAVWTQNPTYTVAYNGNGSTGGTVPTDANAYQQLDLVTVKANTGNLVRTGYTFAGWNSESDGSGFSFTSGATFNMEPTNVTLYAKWTVAVLTVKFNSNGGIAVDSQNVIYNATATSPAAPTRSGFVFAGWYSDQALTVQFSFLTPITSAITLYAKWTPVYTVTYNGNGNSSGTAPVDTNKYANGIVVTVLNNTGSLAKTGYAFAGWNTSADGSGVDRTTGSTFQMGSTNVVLYAKWTPNTYVVTFDGQGATTPSNPATMSVTSPATTIASLPAPPAKTSYVFAGWYTAVNGGGTPFTASTVVNTNITVYAKWEIRDADGNVYTETTINGKVWMVQNLKTTRFNDGTMIPQVKDSGLWVFQGTPAFCWFNNDSATYKNAYGGLYNWYAASSGKLAPTGWHVPTDPEWMALFNYYGGQVQATSDSLREQGTAHWPAPNTGATNSSGFTAIPTGTRSNPTPAINNGGFISNSSAFWWTSTASGVGNGWFYHVGETYCEQLYGQNSFGINVRCVRDY
ncbi:MAG TPA: InlB B-repeat-containing protein [Chitinivibrionales bacterium]|nr:InlB B-repeat-containing protein [Chitinivibrionales bacterium]